MGKYPFLDTDKTSFENSISAKAQPKREYDRPARKAALETTADRSVIKCLIKY